jgi:hypothetical protein
MNAKFLQRVLSSVERHLESKPSPTDFELAYQVRTACDRIRFAIKNTEQCATHSSQVCEANLQLLDALDRLESADRHFQDRFRTRTSPCSEQDQPFITNGDGALEKHY